MISEDRLGKFARRAIQRSISQPRGDSAPQTTADPNSYFTPLAGVEPQEIALAALMRSLRDERRRGRAGHWSYDLNRHLALAQAYARELQNQRTSNRENPGQKTGS